MRICFLSPNYVLQPPYGGIATYTADAGRWLAAHGHEVHVVLVSRTGPHDIKEDAGVMIHTVPTQRIKPRRLLAYAAQLPGLSALQEAYAGWNLVEDSAGAWKAVRTLSKSCPFDVVESADYSGLGFWGVVRDRRTVPVLLRGHGVIALAIPEERSSMGCAFHYALESFTARHADFVLANSIYTARAYQRQFRVPDARVGVHRLPFSDAVGTPSGHDIRQLMGWSESDPIVLFVGRLEKRKGIDLLLQALMAAHAQFPAIRVVLLGALTDCPRSLYDEFMAEARDWAYHPGRVDFEVVRSVMLSSNLLVLPSRSEPLGRVLVEAQLAGLPVVGTRVGGIPEALVEGTTGLLVEPDRVEALSRAILELCQSEEMRIRMGANAREWAVEQYEINKVMKKQVEVYRALADGRSPLQVLAE